jgi:hypothetical protein
MGYSSSISNAASTARPCLVRVSPPATSRSTNLLTTVVVTVARVMPARSHSIRVATRNSRRRARMLSVGLRRRTIGLWLCHVAPLGVPAGRRRRRAAGIAPAARRTRARLWAIAVVLLQQSQ